MVQYRTGKLSDKQKNIIYQLLNSLIDLHGDFYITKDNLRLYLKDNLSLLEYCVRNGDKLAYSENGIALVTGFSDKSQRKYIKFLVSNIEEVEKLLKVIDWNLNITLFAKLKKRNPIVHILKNNGFQFRGDRGKEILLVRQGENYA